MEKIINLNELCADGINKNLFNKIISIVKDKVATLVFVSALSLSPTNANDDLWENYHDFLYWVENGLKDIWILDKEQKYRAQLYFLFDEKGTKKWGFKFRSDNDLLKWEFWGNSTWVWFIDKNDIYNREEFEVFFKYWISYYKKEENEKNNYWISTWVNLENFNTKLEAWIFNNKLSDFSKEKKVIYSEIVKNFYPEIFPKIKVSGAISNYDWINNYSWGVRTYYWNDISIEGLYDSNKKNNWVNLWFQVFVKFYKSWPEIHTKVHYKNKDYTFRVINQWNIINQPDDTRGFFENNIAWF